VSQKGNTPLHTASLAGKADVAKILIDAGSNVNAQSQVRSPVLYCYLRLTLTDRRGNVLTRVCLFVCFLAV